MESPYIPARHFLRCSCSRVEGGRIRRRETGQETLRRERPRLRPQCSLLVRIRSRCITTRGRRDGPHHIGRSLPRALGPRRTREGPHRSPRRPRNSGCPRRDVRKLLPSRPFWGNRCLVVFVVIGAGPPGRADDLGLGAVTYQCREGHHCPPRRLGTCSQ